MVKSATTNQVIATSVDLITCVATKANMVVVVMQKLEDSITMLVF